MKASTLLLLSSFLITGCVSSGSRQMSVDHISSLKPGETTRTQMVHWFGQPFSVGIESSGRSTAVWHHTKVISVPFYFNLQQQVLAAVFETNNVLFAFTVSDQIQQTNSAPTRLPPARTAKGAQ
jgi:outer membrane protein assembly factor BamE (lipoprotein component of BamABCDE complex)